jgi:RHS repeat-associated protein
LYRRTLVEETSGGADIAAWKFFGPQRVAEVTLANGLTRTCMNNARTHCAVQSTVSNPAWGNVSSDRLGYDGAGGMIAKRYLPSTLNGSNGYYDTTALAGFTTTFDKSSNKLFERHLHAENRSYLYNALDSMNRLREYQRGTLATGGSTVASATTLPGADSQRSYDLDGLGNWRRTSFIPVGGSTTTEVRQHNPLNQITRTDSTHLAYDDNGNLTDDGALLLEYDPFNRLKRVKNKSNSQTVGEYTYDAMGRRVRKVITNGGITGTLTNGTTDYLYDQNQCVEERDGSNSHTKQYIWGVYIDELIQQKTYVATGEGGLAAGAYYPLQDPHYRVMALTDDAGDVVEAYDYDPYGKRQVFSAAGTDSTWFTNDDTIADDASCQYGHQGLLHDEETGLVYNRARMLHPGLGRFVQRDSIGYQYGMSLYQYLRSNPLTSSDPWGLCTVDLNPNGSIPPALGSGSTFDGTDIWPNTAPERFYHFYVDPKFTRGLFPNPNDNLIIGGAFLADITSLPDVQQAMTTVRQLAKNDAASQVCKIKCGSTCSVLDRGSFPITAPVSQPHIRLSLQRFTIYWESNCSVGPAECDVPDSSCSNGCATKAKFFCGIKWTLYDRFDFRSWEPYGWIGTPFNVFGYWNDTTAGILQQCCSGK